MSDTIKHGSISESWKVGSISETWKYGVLENNYPEYPGASLTEGVQNYASSIDASFTNLNARYYFPTGATNLPMLTCIHGYEQIATDIGVETLRRFARLGYFVVAVEMRGSTGSGGNSGTRDASGREKQDVYDAEEAIKTAFLANIAFTDSVCRQGIFGMSGGGIIAWNMLQAYPDRYTGAAIYFGISDYTSWYNEAPPRQASLQSYIGGTPVAKPDEYSTRNARLRLANIMCHVTFCHDTADASVAVTHAQAMRDLYVVAARTDYYYNESTVGSPYRWSHGSPDTYPDLVQMEQYWKNKPKQGLLNTVATSGTLKVPGRLHTKRFQIWMNDGSYTNAGRSRFGTVTYNTATNSYSVTNDSANYAVVTILTSDGLVATGVLNAGETHVFTPATLVVDGNTPIMWFDAASKKSLSGSDITCIADKTGGPQYQGYALSFITARPALLASDLNSLPAMEFILASTEGLTGLRRPDLQGIGAFTFIEVGTGTIIDHGFSANAQTQFSVLSGVSYFYAVNNGSAANGSDAGTNSYLVRSVIFDGSQTGNAARLVRRENKVAQTVTFSGTIPTTTENNAASVFGIGKRSYSANYFTGKVAEFIIFNTALADVGDKEDILKTKYAI